MDPIRRIAAGMTGVLFLVVVVAILMAGMAAIARLIEAVLPAVVWISAFVTFVCLFILVPLGIFQRSRPLSANGLLIASFWFGVSAWLYSFVTTFAIWGTWGLLIGLVFFGVGVIPLAMLAALFNGAWTSLGDIAYALVLAIGSRWLALYLLSRVTIVPPNTIDLSPDEWTERHEP